MKYFEAMGPVFLVGAKHASEKRQAGSKAEPNRHFNFELSEPSEPGSVLARNVLS